jgi:hypothetical protein
MASPDRRFHEAVFAVGALLWLLALAVLLVAGAGGAATGRWPLVCGTGAVLGAGAFAYARVSWRAR